MFTTDADYGELIRHAAEHQDLFGRARKKFEDLMLSSRPIVMVAGKGDPQSGEIVMVEFEHAKRRR